MPAELAGRVEISTTGPDECPDVLASARRVPLPCRPAKQLSGCEILGVLDHLLADELGIHGRKNTA
jgi:hypothetical protein